jgi:hypothetical protein
VCSALDSCSERPAIATSESGTVDSGGDCDVRSMEAALFASIARFDERESRASIGLYKPIFGIQPPSTAAPRLGAEVGPGEGGVTITER